jgi:hypothetical protein
VAHDRHGLPLAHRRYDLERPDPVELAMLRHRRPRAKVIRP